MKTVCEGVLNGLISFCADVKKSCGSYGLVQEKKLVKGSKTESSGKTGNDLTDISAMPENLVEELKRIRSIDGDVDRLGYDSLIIKFYKAELKSKNVFD